jgi:hypothetical protein
VTFFEKGWPSQVEQAATDLPKDAIAPAAASLLQDAD